MIHDHVLVASPIARSIGEPKGVMVSFRALSANVKLLRYYFSKLDPKGPDRLVGISWLPPYHDLGLVVGVIAPFAAGWRQHLMSPLSFIQKPILWPELMSRLKVTWGVSPDFGFRLAARKFAEATSRNSYAKLDLSSVRWVMSCAEPMRVDTKELFGRTFFRYGLTKDWFSAGYGLAENVVCVSFVRGYVLSSATGNSQDSFVASGDTDFKI